MKPTNKFLIAALISFFLFPVLENSARAQGFNEQFNSTTLDPAWTVVQTWPGGAPRAHGFTQPGNHYSLTDNPGFLRYSLDPMTHFDGFLNGYATTFGYHSCCNHDAGLEIHRAFSGNNWRFEAGGNFFLPFTNGRSFGIRIYFGTGAVPTYLVDLRRSADVNQNTVGLHLVEKTGAALGDQTFHQSFNANGTWYYGVFNYPTAPLFFRVERAGGVLTAYWSDDGAAWNTAWSHDLGSALDGLDQRVVVTGLSWFNTGGSYADYDYVLVTPTNQPPVAITQNVTVSAGADCTANASVDNGSFDPDGDPITISQSPAGPYPLGSTLVTLTVTDSKGSSAQSTATVTVVDDTSPTITNVAASPSVLWPPNHKMVDVIINYDTLDNCGAVSCSLNVISNEPINGSGHDTSDWEIVDAHHVKLRAKRSSTGNGRIYTISITCTDSAGNSSSQTVMVNVPGSRS